jgi:hypothetical protein
MRVLFHPEFAQDVLRFQSDYARVSAGLGERFRREVDDAIIAITRSPTSAGHFVECKSRFIRQLRRRNLHSFPFFVLYGSSDDTLVLGSVIPSRSDPLTWLVRFES